MTKWNYEHFMQVPRNDLMVYVVDKLKLNIDDADIKLVSAKLRTKKQRTRVWAIIVAYAMKYIDHDRALELIYDEDRKVLDSEGRDYIQENKK